MNTQSLIDESKIPKYIALDGKKWMVISTMQNVFYRALVLPIGGGNPQWLSNEKLRSLILSEDNTVS